MERHLPGLLGLILLLVISSHAPTTLAAASPSAALANEQCSSLGSNLMMCMDGKGVPHFYDIVSERAVGAVVQVNSQSCGVSCSSLNASFSSNVTHGDKVIVVVTSDCYTCLFTVFDSRSTTYVQQDRRADIAVHTFVGNVSSSGADTVTAFSVMGNPGNAHLSLTEASGLPAIVAPLLDVETPPPDEGSSVAPPLMVILAITLLGVTVVVLPRFRNPIMRVPIKLRDSISAAMRTEVKSEGFGQPLVAGKDSNGSL